MRSSLSEKRWNHQMMRAVLVRMWNEHHLSVQTMLLPPKYRNSYEVSKQGIGFSRKWALLRGGSGRSNVFHAFFYFFILLYVILLMLTRIETSVILHSLQMTIGSPGRKHRTRLASILTSAVLLGLTFVIALSCLIPLDQDPWH